ncbi:hypothetical protein BH10ACT11_BH10ACT11_18720 [soil metagenome]
MSAPAAGICNLCLHQRLVPNSRGSVFSLCGRSTSDDSFPRYPRLPVASCRGFEAAAPTPPREDPQRS